MALRLIPAVHYSKAAVAVLARPTLCDFLGQAVVEQPREQTHAPSPALDGSRRWPASVP